MARLFYGDIDLQQNELQNVIAQNATTDLSTPLAGQFYFNSVSNTFKYFDGTVWVEIGAAVTDDLTTTLGAGNTTSGIDIIVTNGDSITSSAATVTNQATINFLAGGLGPDTIEIKQNSATANTGFFEMRNSGGAAMGLLTNSQADVTRLIISDPTKFEFEVPTGEPTLSLSGVSSIGSLTQQTLTGDRTWTLPDTTGTIALTSDLLVVAAGSTDYLTITGNEISVSALAVTDTTVDSTNATIAAFVTASYTGTEFQEGDIVILTTATTEADRTWIHNGGTAGTAADFTPLSVTLEAGTVRGFFTGGDGITYNSGTGEIETTVDDTTIELSATDGSGVLQVKANGISESQLNIGLGAGQVNANIVPVIDIAGNFVGTTVETVLTELNSLIAGVGGTFIGGDGITYNSGTGEIETTVDDTTIGLSATDGSGVLEVKVDGINDTHIDFGTGVNQVNAEDIPVIDIAGDFTATDIEGVLSEIQGNIDAIPPVTIAADGSQNYLSVTNNELSVKNLLITDVTVDAVSTTITAFVTTSYTGTEFQEGDIVMLTSATAEEDRTWIHNGGTAGTVADFTQVTSTLDSATVRGLFSGGAGIAYNAATGEFSITDDNKGVQVNADSLEIDGSEIAGNGLVENGTNSWQLDIDDATSAEAEAQTSTTKVVTPASLVNFGIQQTFDITGDALTTDFVLTHSLNNQWVSVQVYQAGSPFAQITPDAIELTSTNTTTVKFASAPAVSEDFKVVIIGS